MGTLTVFILANGALHASSSGSFTDQNLVQARLTENSIGNCNSLPEMAYTNLALRVFSEKVGKNCPRYSQLRYATDVNVWRGIKPLTSTRADVERILGVPTDSLRQTFMYEKSTDKINVLYSGPACEQTEIGRWNVPENTVLKVKVIPQRTLLIKALKFDRSKYKRIREAHPENWVHYFNLEEGITIDVEIRGGREEVMSLVYEPSSKQKSLRCVEGARP